MKKFFRSNDKMIAGICGGIGEYFNIDPTWIRIGYVVVSIFSAAFPGLLLYLILWIVIPKNPNNQY
ncbi:MAG: hypothetical protein C0425_03065 [Chlorobiaceae bacterium]|nr:hypothetical protein [Chlorobiaceae bacterium]MBA4309300.1 hypothetical protein [Chlorobiaceae bacterium]